MSIRIWTTVSLAVLVAVAISAQGAEPMRRLPPVDRALAPAQHPRTIASEQESVPTPSGITEPAAAAGKEIWWESAVQQPQRAAQRYIPVDPQGLMLAALSYSDHVRAIQLTPEIIAEDVNRAQAAFDINAFLESKFDDLSEPVGNTLTTGGPPRLNDHHLRTNTGLRKKTSYGGTLELSQQVGLQDTNSLFFLPTNQSQTRLTLGLTQPLLKQNGRMYTQSVVVLAELDTNVAQQQVAAQLQDHFYKVLQAYWDLFLQRSLVLQRRRSLDETRLILQRLEERRGLDVLSSQIARARAAVATRQSSLIRAEADVRNAEARLRTLTNAPDLNRASDSELSPVELPPHVLLPIDDTLAMQVATQRRPEVAAALERLRAAQVRVGVSRNELLPTLNLVLQSYVSGLQGQYDVLRSIEQQFNAGAPSYTAGLMFQVPLGNEAAKAEHRKRTRELSQLMYELNSVLSTVALDVEVALRDVQATYQETIGRTEAMRASQQELDYLRARWRMLPGDERLVSFLLDETLDAHDRLLESEAACARAQTDYALALARLRRATGELVQIAGPSSAEPVPVPVPSAQEEIMATRPAVETAPTERPGWRR